MILVDNTVYLPAYLVRRYQPGLISIDGFMYLRVGLYDAVNMSMLNYEILHQLTLGLFLFIDNCTAWP